MCVCCVHAGEEGGRGAKEPYQMGPGVAEDGAEGGSTGASEPMRRGYEMTT